uniref:p17 n=1 Tax=Pacific black duck orthoreovirus TaxID=2798289 RepID=A0A7T4S0B4_9REOV|nr:p17 [Pacific black duck orthoreovirus]
MASCPRLFRSHKVESWCLLSTDPFCVDFRVSPTQSFLTFSKFDRVCTSVLPHYLNLPFHFGIAADESYPRRWYILYAGPSDDGVSRISIYATKVAGLSDDPESGDCASDLPPPLPVKRRRLD